MHNSFEIIYQRLLDLVTLRHQRALAGMPENYQHVYRLLPLLLHYHHAALPGYANDVVPCGIATFQPEKQQLTDLQQHFADFKPTQLIQSHPAIAGLYSMGSTGSLGQSTESDLDVWVCIEESLSTTAHQALLHKCRLIEQWAKQQQVALSLFVVDVNRFRRKQHDCLIGDNCGSAQHILLLEEFYRTANVMAGKLLLWYCVPPQYKFNDVVYDSYEACIAALIEHGVIRREEWIDFGTLASLSAEEYFGASLWQLYKSIDSPFKAVLKNLLLESYAANYAHGVLLADEIKAQLHHNQHCCFELDPYYMLFRSVSNYLIANHDTERLELARRCFYLKVGEKLSQPATQPSWRRQALQQIVQKWGWQQSKLAALDRSEDAKIRQVRQTNDALLNALMTGYRNLLSFGRRNNLQSQISPKDLAILTRKLYAAFEVLPSKVSIINPNIARDLSEPDLTFIHVQQDRINRAGWYLYNRRPEIQSIISTQYLEYSPQLVKLVAWCYFNGLIADQTQFFVHDGHDHTNQKLQLLVNDLRDYFSRLMPSASEEALFGPCEIRQMAIMLNLQDDPTSSLTPEALAEQGELEPNVLSFGSSETSLIGSIDLLYRNSWNEIRCLHFSGNRSVLDALKTVLNRMHQAADVPESIEIFCYSKHFQSQIKQQIDTLIKRCVALRLSSTQQNLTRFKPLRLGGVAWGLFFERLGVSVHRFNNAIDFYGAISNNKLRGQALNIADETNELPKVIDSVACEGIIQFFFEDTKSGFDLYILNEHNQVEIYRNCNGSKQNMINDVNQFYTLADDRFSFETSSAVNFNLPQFYQIIHQADKCQVVSFNEINELAPI